MLNCRRDTLYRTPERRLDATTVDQLQVLIRHYQDGMPLEYITGWCDFYHLRLKVSPQVMVPRPETEQLVTEVLSRMQTGDHILELGTGSGAIALAIHHHASVAHTLLASDISTAAITLAQTNAEHCRDHHGRRHVSCKYDFVQRNWFDNITQRFNIIVSNPPYVAYNDAALEPGVAKYEPATALFADKEGLACLEHIIMQAPSYLHNKGWLLLEHGATQEEPVAQFMRNAGFVSHCIKDSTGLPRLSIAQAKQ